MVASMRGGVLLWASASCPPRYTVRMMIAGVMLGLAPGCVEPNAYVDISSTMDRKLEAIAAHKSQFYSRGLAFEFYRDLAKVTGRMVGVEYAEALAVDKIVFA